ncbi:TIGR03943 family putative permease subunit [Desulfovibrio sp.]
MRGRVMPLLDGLALLLLGGLLAGLALSDRYWYFLNPRFIPVSLVTGAILILLAPLAATRAPGPRPGGVPRLLSLGLCLGLAALAVSGVGSEPSAAPTPSQAPRRSSLEPGPEPVEPSRVTFEGREYVRMNLAELFLLADQRPKDAPARFVVRGEVRRSPALDGQGQALVSRVAVVCCLADAVAAGFLADVGDLPQGRWVEVYGRLEPLARAPRSADLPRSPEAAVTVCNEHYRIAVEGAVPVSPPEMPYIFEFREKEPYAW